MKSLFSVLALFLASTLYAGDTLEFFTGTYDQLLAEAEAAQKPVMLYFHFYGCGACEKMEQNVFVDEGVMGFYNGSFLLFEVDIKEEEGVKVNAMYDVHLAPSFIFLNPEGEQIHKIVGSYSAEDFIRAGKIAVNEEETLVALQKRYEEGDRSSDFLYQYSSVLRDANVADSTVISQYLQTLSQEELETEQTLSFIYEYSFIHHDAIFSFYSPAMRALRANKSIVYAKYDSANVESRIMYTALGDLGQAIDNKDKEKYDELIAYLETYLPREAPFLVFPEVDGRFTMAIHVSGLVEGFQLRGLISFEGADSAVQYLTHKVPDPAELEEEELLEYVAVIRRITVDATLLNMGMEWVEVGVKQYPSYLMYSVYGQYLYDLERYPEAKEAILKSIELGEADGYYCQKEEELLVLIEGK